MHRAQKNPDEALGDDKLIIPAFEIYWGGFDSLAPFKYLNLFW